MARKPKGLTKPIAKTAARMSRKAALTPTNGKDRRLLAGLELSVRLPAVSSGQPPAETAA